MLDESCGNDVEDELAQELDDNPGTTTSTNFPSCKEFTHILSQLNNRVPRRVFQAPDDSTAGVSSSNCTVTKSSRS